MRSSANRRAVCRTINSSSPKSESTAKKSTPRNAIWMSSSLKHGSRGPGASAVPESGPSERAGEAWQRAIQLRPRDRQREPHVPRPPETRPGHREDTLVLQDANERDVVRDGGFGEDVVGALR